jgi:NADH:ubiquinone oxidoreductase subunit 4 (subunit M)
MATWLTILMILAPLGFADLSRRARSSIGARRRATLGAFAVVLASIGVAVVTAYDLSPSASLPGLGAPRERWHVLLPLFVSVIAFTSIAMTPARCARPETFARTLVMLSASLGLVVSNEPMALALFAALGTLAVVRELRANVETRAAARSFSAYLIPSTLFIVAASALEIAGEARVAFTFLLAGLAIREAIVPFHSWLPRFFDRAPMGLAVMFVTPQLGVYLHLRAVSADLDAGFEGIIAALAAVTAVYAAMMGAVQERPRRALGYLLMSQTSLVVVGLESSSAQGHAGALASWLVSGLALTGLSMTLAALEARRGRISLDHPSGNYERAPMLAASFLVLGLASVGAPFTFGFVAGDLLFEGAAHSFPILGAMLIFATAINSINVARGFFAAFTGERSDLAEQDLTFRERVALGVLLGALLVLGSWPATMVRWLDIDGVTSIVGG